MRYGNIIAIGHLDVRHLNQPGKIVVETPLASASQLIAIGAGTAAALLAVGVIATRTIAIGDGALAVANAASADNIAVGHGAGATVGVGVRSIFVGRDAGALATGSDDSVLIGNLVAAALTTADNETVIGSGAAPVMTGANNLIAGRAAAGALTTGQYNTIIGMRNTAGTAPAGPTTSSSNIVIGPFDSVGGRILAEIPAGATGSYIVLAGGTSIVVVDPALSSVSIGSAKPGNWRTATGTSNVAIGAAAGDAITSGARNIGVGTNALGRITTGADNIAIGNSAMLGAAGSEAALRNVAIGSFALDAMGAAVTDVVAVGYNAGSAVTSAIEGVYVGRSAGASVTTGAGGVHVGRGAGINATIGPYNTLIGYNVAPTLTTGDHNVVIGAVEDTSTLADVSDSGATGQIVIAAEQTLEGPAFQQSLIVVALDNVFAGGYKPGNWKTSTGTGNVGIGRSALSALTNGPGNTGVGFNALGSVTTGDYNTALGHSAGDNAVNGDENILIGHNADVPAAGDSFHLNIGTTIYGDLANGDVRIGGTNTLVAQTERLAVTDTNADTVAPFSVETTGANGAKIAFFSGTRDPNGLVTGNPGDMYFRANGVLSRPYINTGAGAGTTWVLV